MPFDQQQRWVAAVEYFGREQRFLKDIRNDVGGHFGLTVARHTVANISNSATGRVEIETTVKGHTPLLYFAGELASTAILRHLPGADADEKFGRFLREHVLVASEHATNAANVVTAEYLFPRFRKD